MNFDLAALQNELIRDEGLKLKPYRDTRGILTIGVGRNLEGVGISEREAKILLANDIVSVASQLDTALPWWKSLSDGRQRALINMGFMGVQKLLGFKNMLAALQAGDWDTASREALDSDWAREVKARANRVAVLILEG
jgi:lysozyme